MACGFVLMVVAVGNCGVWVLLVMIAIRVDCCGDCLWCVASVACLLVVVCLLRLS